MIGPIIGNEQYVPILLQSIKEHYKGKGNAADNAPTEVALIVSDHPSLVGTLTKIGFNTVFELGAMTLHGIPMPGNRDKYLGLIHPTLG